MDSGSVTQEHTLALNQKKMSMFYAAAYLMLLFCTLLYCFFDAQLLSYWSVNFWDVTFKGRPLDYYSYNYLMTSDSPVAATVGPMTNIIPRAVWNFPLWLIRRYTGIEVQHNAWCLLWSKLQYLLFLALFCKEIYRLSARVLQEKWQAQLVTFLSLSSLFTIVSVGYTGQNDVFWMYLSILALNCHAQGQHKRFFLLSAYTISCKPFFALAYALIILLNEKRLTRIALKAVIGISIAFPQALLLRQAKDYAFLSSKSQVKSMLDDIILRTNLDLPKGSISLFILSMTLILLSAYLKNPEDAQEKERILIRLITAAYSSLLLFSDFDFYRPFILLPWIYLFVMQSRTRYISFVILLESLFSSALCVILIGNGSPIFDPVAFHNSIIVKDVLAISRRYDFSFEALSPFLRGSIPHSILITLSAVIVLLIVWLIIGKTEKYPLPRHVEQYIKMLDIRWVLVLRLLFSLSWILFSLVLCYY